MILTLFLTIYAQNQSLFKRGTVSRPGMLWAAEQQGVKMMWKWRNQEKKATGRTMDISIADPVTDFVALAKNASNSVIAQGGIFVMLIV